MVAGTGVDGIPTRDPDVATFANGTSIIVYQPTLAGDDNIHYRILDAAGTAFIGGAQVIDDTAVTDHQRPVVAAFGNQALVVFEDETNDDVLARFYDATGNTVGALQTIATTGNLNNPDVAALTDGRYIVVWDNEDTDDIEGRLVDAAGNPVGSVFVISNIGGNNDDPRVAALPGGGFVVTWENNGGNFPTEADDGDNAIVARRFDGNGAPAGDLFLVNTGDRDTAGHSGGRCEHHHRPGLHRLGRRPRLQRGGWRHQPARHPRPRLPGDHRMVNGPRRGPHPDLQPERDDQWARRRRSINGLGGDDIIHGGAGFDHITGGRATTSFRGGRRGPAQGRGRR